MRKAQKEQAMDFLNVLEQAHDRVKKTIEQKDIQAALALLEDCQEGAIALGTLIEKAEGEGFVTVAILEEYCELTYQLHEKLANGDGISANKAYKSLKQMLTKIAGSIRHDITVRREVVFLPYKASMWDSLESVWKAADADPECDAYVIPIPYYDKNPDGSFREFHYEGKEYPKNVPVVSYEEYDFEERRPDEIYIHNPYDECNYVTSVHPFFYSKNLKQYTEMLIYIPYFILDEIDPGNKSAVDRMKHFVITPAVINADKVIVQSEDMRRIYINVMMEHTGKDETSRKYWEEKILGLGSPKVDRVINTGKEDLEIPEEWLKIIKKPDGSWKQIIFYNTSITALLEYNEQMLTKMQDVFRIFYENRNEVALLWRPHPLIESTLASMRPQLWEEYRKIRDRYIADGWGIYDDTADMDRAVVLSDAYYGDWSSVVHLCQKAGLPIMLQDVDVVMR